MILVLLFYFKTNQYNFHKNFAKMNDYISKVISLPFVSHKHCNKKVKRKKIGPRPNYFKTHFLSVFPYNLFHI